MSGATYSYHAGGQLRPIVLVGFAEAMSAPEVVWSLVDDGFEVVAFSRRGRASALHHSKYVRCHEICSPEENIENALADLKALMASLSTGAREVPSILFPLDDTGVWLSNKLDIGDGWVLAGPAGFQANVALDKSLQVEMASEAGFNVPRTLLARTSSQLRAFGREMPFPIILRQSDCVGEGQNKIQHCRKWICDNTDELERAIAEWAERMPLLAQPFITGTGEGVFGLATTDGVKAWSGHRRLRMMNPQGSGSSACISQDVTESFKETISRLIKRVEWRGLFMIELLRDRSGGVWFVEINGRPWGSMALSRRQGLEYPAWHVMLALNERSSAGYTASSASGVVCRNLGRELMNVLFVLRGPKSKALNNWPSFWKTLFDVLKVNRGDAFYNWRRDDPKVFLADCYYTIHGNLFKPRA